MTYAKIRQLLLAIHAGQIQTEADSLDALGISTPTFWRWVGEARAQGVRLENFRTGKGPGWRITNWGPFRKEKPRKAA